MMTRDELMPHFTAYAAGIEAELSLLRQLERLSAAEHEATRERDIDRLNRIIDERDRLMAGLVRIEHQIKTSRHLLSEHRAVAESIPGFEDVVKAHRAAGALVVRILEADEATKAALREAERARRTAAQALETGEHTLAAYKRVMLPGASGPSLVDRRG